MTKIRVLASRRLLLALSDRWRLRRRFSRGSQIIGTFSAVDLVLQRGRDQDVHILLEPFFARQNLVPQVRGLLLVDAAEAVGDGTSVRPDSIPSALR